MTRLAKTGKFTLLESSLPALEAIKAYKLTPTKARFLIVGSISEYGRSTTSDVSLPPHKKTKSLRIRQYSVDTLTSEVIYSEEAYGEAFNKSLVRSLLWL